MSPGSSDLRFLKYVGLLCPSSLPLCVLHSRLPAISYSSCRQERIRLYRNCPVIRLEEAEFRDLKQAEFFLETFSQRKSPEIPKMWVLFLVLPLKKEQCDLGEAIVPFRGASVPSRNQEKNFINVINVRKSAWWILQSQVTGGWHC